MPEQFTKTSDGGLSVVNGIDPPLAWDFDTSTLRPAGVTAPTATPGLAFTGVGTITGSYYAYVRYIDRYNQPSNLSPISAVATASSNLTATYTGLPVPTQSTIARRQILRNTAGQLATFYVDIDTTDLSSSNLPSTRTDTDLATQEAVPILFSDGRPAADRYYPPPNDRPFSASHINRLWLAGIQPYREGAIITTFGGTTVTGIGTRWASSMAGRQLFAGNRVYNVTAIDPVTQVATIDRSYTGASDPYARYCIQPALAEHNFIYFSEAGSPEAFSITEALTVADEGGEVTGLMPLNSYLYILKASSIYRFTGQDNPATDGTIFFDSNRGCVNNRCWQVVDGTAYLLDEKGIYSYSGGEFESKSDSIFTIFSNENNYYGIQWSQSRFFHSVHDRGNGVMRWFVTMGGGYLPLHAISLDYGSGRWWVERYYRCVGSSVVGDHPIVATTWRSVNRDQIYLGLDAKTVAAFGESNLDGTAGDPLFAGKAVLSTADTITLPANVAIPVNAVIHITRGKGIGQSRRAVELLADNRVRVMHPWTVLPDATSYYQVAGVKAEYRTGHMFRPPSEGNQTTRFTLHWKPVEDDVYAAVRVYNGWDAAAQTQEANLSFTERDGALVEAGSDYQLVNMAADVGNVQVRADTHRAENVRAQRTTTVDIKLVAGGEPVGLRQVDVSGVEGGPQGGGG
jgi:hypothetical protein